MPKRYYAVNPNFEKVYFYATDLIQAKRTALTLGFIPVMVKLAEGI